MDFVGAIKAGFQNYAVFKGTASRSEYWYWVLFTSLVGIVTNALDATAIVASVFSLATFLPSFGVLVRRLRDAGFSWTWLLLPIPGLIPFAYGLYLFFSELVFRGVAEVIWNNPELVDEAFIRELVSFPEIMNALLILLSSLLYLFASSLLVNVIFPIRKSKSFEQGNKRVAPKGPETPAL
jgi:uncharacterized membrane protein YhaH (DUF805 family)